MKTQILLLTKVYNNDFNLIKSMLNSHYPNSIHEPKLGLCFFQTSISHEYKIIFPRDALSNCLLKKWFVILEKNTRNFLQCSFKLRYRM